MWYAVETAFIDGKHLSSIPLFDPDAGPDPCRVQKGTCLCRHDEEPHNSVQSFLGGRIEIHTDWFKSKEQAKRFIDGSLTYVIHFSDHYHKDINSTIPEFIRWEAVETSDDRPPFRGIYEHHKC